MEKHNAALRHDYNNFQDQSRQALHEAQESQQRMSEHYERVFCLLVYVFNHSPIFLFSR